MRRPKPNRAEHNARAFVGHDMLVPVPMTTLSDEYRDEPAEPEDSDRAPEPEPPGIVRRVLDRLSRSPAGPPGGRQSVEAHAERPHPFQETDDPGIVSAASAAGDYEGALANLWAVTTASLRGTRCALSGCGRERHDPIHTRALD